MTANVENGQSELVDHHTLGKVIGKPMLFSLTNSWAKLYQVDTLRKYKETEREF